jgi:hypothetical protein
MILAGNSLEFTNTYKATQKTFNTAKTQRGISPVQISILRHVVTGTGRRRTAAKPLTSQILEEYMQKLGQGEKGLVWVEQ